MRPAIKAARAFSRAALAALAVAVATATAWADTRVAFSRLTDGPDFAEAMEFFNGWFPTPDYYNTEKSLRGTGGSWKLGTTLDLYLREFVLLGKGDVDGDGIDERFYYLGDPGWCGSKGCRILIVQRRQGVSKVLCETTGSDHWVWITDRVGEGGFRELQAAFPVYWRDGKCDWHDPEVEQYLRGGAKQ